MLALGPDPRRESKGDGRKRELYRKVVLSAQVGRPQLQGSIHP